MLSESQRTLQLKEKHAMHTDTVIVIHTNQWHENTLMSILIQTAVYTAQHTHDKYIHTNTLNKQYYWYFMAG